MNHQKIAGEIWENYNSEKWNTHDFSVKKSFICSRLSELAYEHIPQFELNQKSRIKIIPSKTYWENYINKISVNISEILPRMDLGENFIIEGEYLIILGIQLKETIFISIRGTQSLNDFIADIKFIRKRYRLDKKVKLHSGFYDAVLQEYDHVIEKLSKYSHKNIYVTGHSLGGAMAAILFKMLGMNPLMHSHHLNVQSCYTFGMPRFGNNEALKYLNSLFAIYHPNDIVPLMPPKSFGYANALIEYKLLKDNIIKTPNIGRLTFRRVCNLLYHKDFKEHYINSYSKNLRSII